MSGNWGSVLAGLIPLALVVALSPLSIIPAVLLVLHTVHPRPTGLAFLVGWLAGLAASTAVFVQVPRLLGGLHQAPPRWATWVRIVVGAVLIAGGVWRWATRKRSARSPAWLTSLNKITPARAAVIGVVLAVANPKVFFMNAAAGLAIGTAGLGVAGAGIAIAYYTALAGSTVAVPVVAHAMTAERLDQPLERLKEWMERQHAVLAAAILVVIGLVLLYTGIHVL